MTRGIFVFILAILLSGCTAALPGPTLSPLTGPAVPLNPTQTESSPTTSTPTHSTTLADTQTIGVPTYPPGPTHTPTQQFPAWFTPFPPAAARDAALIYPELTHQPVPLYEFGDAPTRTNILTWLDLNENGIYEPDEPPMPGIQIYLDTEYDNLRNDPPLGIVTNSLGWTNVQQGSNPYRFSSYYPEIPPGYRLTTPEFQVVTGPGSPLFANFGFAQLPGIATPIPPGQSSLCEIIPDANGIVSMAPDGALWAIQEAGEKDFLARRDPQTRLWQQHEFTGMLPTRQFNKISFGTFGNVFVNSVAGMLVFDGKSFEAIGEDDGLLDGYIRSTAEAQDGSCFIVTKTGLSRYDPKTRNLVSQSLNDRLPAMVVSEYLTLDLLASPDGSMWIVDPYGSLILNFTLSPQGMDFAQFKVYDREAGEGVLEHPFKTELSPRNIAFESDGKAWFTYKARLYSYGPRTDEWELFKPPDALDDPLPDYPWFSSVAVGPDGSVWTTAETSSEPLLYRLLPDRQTWQAYTRASGLPDFGDAAFDVMVSPDGAVWYSSGDWLLRCVLHG